MPSYLAGVEECFPIDPFPQTELAPNVYFELELSSGNPIRDFDAQVNSNTNFESQALTFSQGECPISSSFSV
jgi:hypothetical protein